jgi:hypothetical protein
MTEVISGTKHVKMDVATSGTNATGSDKVNLDFSGTNKKGEKINAFRLSGILVMINDLDTIASGDFYTVSLDYQDLNAAALAVITDKDNIVQVGESWELLVSTNGGGIMNVDVKNTGKLFRDGVDFIEIYIHQQEFWINVDTGGQDAAETFHIELIGGYVHLDEHRLKAIREGASSTI